jgi:hypothetical protein
VHVLQYDVRIRIDAVVSAGVPTTPASDDVRARGKRAAGSV